MKRPLFATIVVACLVATSASASEVREVRGRVLDETGKPASGVDIAHFWQSNGAVWNPDGTMIDLGTEKAQKEFQARIGQMGPGAPEFVKTNENGQFSLKLATNIHTLMALDAPRQRGGLGVIPKDDPSKPIEIRLGPLVRVRGTFEGPQKGVRPPWTFIYVHTSEDETRPLDSTRLVGCSSDEARFDMLLCPGRYSIEAYSDKRKEFLSGKQFVVDAGVRELDLGTFLLPAFNSIITQLEQSRANGTFGDYHKHYGRKPPAWHATETRGVKRDVQVGDFEGKWLVIDFWALGCTPCLKKTLPELIAFYEEHADKRDRFEIVSICLDPQDESHTLAQVDRELAPVVKHVWGGKTLPFPVLFDNTFKTWESFGLRGINTTLLVDPEGNLVEGGLEELRASLTQNRRPSRASVQRAIACHWLRRHSQWHTRLAAQPSKRISRISKLIVPLGTGISTFSPFFLPSRPWARGLVTRILPAS